MKFISNKLWRGLKKSFPIKSTKVADQNLIAKFSLKGIICVLCGVCQRDILPEEYNCSSIVHGKLMK